MKKIIFLFTLAAFSFAFIQLTEAYKKDEPQYIPPSKQRTGDAAKGYEYLITGDYLKSGIPYSFFFMGAPKDSNNYLQRSGLNKNLSHDFTAVQAPNGEMVVAPNCLQCHAQFFDGKLIVGLGNSFSDFTMNRAGTALIAENFLKNLKGEQAKKYEAAKNFLTALKTISPNLVTGTKGVNLADGLANL